MLEVKKRENESAAGLIRRFTKKMSESGTLATVRKLKFKNRQKSDLKKKREAIKKAAYKKKVDYLRKIGKI